MEELRSIRELAVEVLVQAKSLVAPESLEEASHEEFLVRTGWLSLEIDCIGLTRLIDHALDKAPEFRDRLAEALARFDVRTKLLRVQEIALISEQEEVSSELERWHEEFSDWIRPFLADEVLMGSLKVYNIKTQ